METRAAPSLPTPRHSPATACYWTTSNIGLSGQNHQHQHPTAGDKDGDNDNEKNKKNENNKNRNKHSHDGNQYSNDDNNKRTTSTACNFTFTPSDAPHGQIALPTAEGFLNWAPVRLTLAVPCSLSTQPHLLTGTSFEGKFFQAFSFKISSILCTTKEWNDIQAWNTSNVLIQLTTSINQSLRWIRIRNFLKIE